MQADCSVECRTLRNPYAGETEQPFQFIALEMDTTGDKWDEYSVIGDKGDIGFIDYEDDKSVCSYNPSEEGPVFISVPFPFVGGKPLSATVGETTTDSVTIKNTTSEPVDLWSVSIYASNPDNSFTLSVMKPPSANAGVEAIQGFLESFKLEDRVLQPGDTFTVWISCRPKEIGLHTTVVHFDVGDDRIERVGFLLAEDKISSSLKSKRPFVRSVKKKQFDADEYVVGSRPARRTDRNLRNRLPRYDIPRNLRELIISKQVPEAISRGLTTENYAHFFQALLAMEEIQMEEDMRRYDMECVTMRRKRYHFLALEVPGLAERRPSLVHGDFIFVKHATEDTDDTSPPYQGFIHHVEADEVYLKFAKEFHLWHDDRNLYNVQFTYNRFNMRRLYQAIHAAEKLDKRFLFPPDRTPRLIKTTPLVPISSNLNEEQIRSVEMVLGCKGAPPYLIYGPPGTGKTLTLVEAILQVYTSRRDSRILICAPSNSAADHILEKLLKVKAVEVKDNDIFRLNATTRPFEDVKPDYIHFCFFDDFNFKCPPLDALMCKRIIISTYMSSSLLYAEGIDQGHFSHIFLDEAGQASEPETMVPISNLCQDTVVVLAGDPMQLGPVVYSREAETYGLGKSYLERLFECSFYCSGNVNYITKLVRNYRCHPEILALPSALFYEGELIACRDDTSSFMKWSSLLPDLFPNKEFPVVFFGIQGSDEREGNNPSWFNRFEISKVVDVIKKLTARAKLNEEDIGVITPYRQQVLKLKEVLERWEMPNVKVGSVEQFQGQERPVIIISTVRSTVKHNEFDRNYCLGFLSNPRRFNVAATRAISLLIIVGNPHIICEDPYWNQLLWHCADNESYQGCPLPDRKVYADELTTEGCSDYKEVSEEGEWGQVSFPVDIPQPITDEAEWSDGWKDVC